MAIRRTRPRATPASQMATTPQVEAIASATLPSSRPVIVVAGDVCIDVLGLERPPSPMGGATTNWILAGQTITQYRRGGAWVAAEMLHAALPHADVRMQAISTKPWGETGPLPDEDLARLKPSDIVHSFLEVGEFPEVPPKHKDDKPPKVLRIKEFHGFAGPVGDVPAALKVTIREDAPHADLVVCDDVGNGFRNRREDWPAAITATHSGEDRPKPLIIYKLHRPLPFAGEAASRPSSTGAKNELWHEIRDHHLGRTIVILDANDLRLADMQISRRLSWERTAKELIWQLLGNPALAPLRDSPHLIVCFGNEAALYYRRGTFDSKAQCDRAPEVTLVYDPVRAEDSFLDEHPGRMSGYRASFTAAIAASLAEQPPELRAQFACETPTEPPPPEKHSGANTPTQGAAQPISVTVHTLLVRAIKAGICVARAVQRMGLGSAEKQPVSMKIPTEGLWPVADDKLAELADVRVPLSDSIDTADPRRWCILLEDGRRGSALESIASEMVIRKSAKRLKPVPQGRFGDLVTYDRTEIEGFRAIRNLIDEFLRQAAPKRPLCLAVFGPPGSGKSFGVEEVAKSVSGRGVKVEKLEFNVSQFTNTDELSAALQLVRDRVLGGEVPLVFFDEFDASLGEQPYGWLKFFLAPMQDGKFLDRGAVHPIGKAIFVFAGGTRSTFQEFCPPVPADPADGSSDLDAARRAYDQFRAAKGPDFVSRLRGYINVLGPNPRDRADHAYVLRRALLLRSLLKRKVKHLFDTRDEAQFDAGVLRAMLKVSRFHHGARSMEAVLDMSMLANRHRFEASALPAADQLELHVPAHEFYQLITADRPFGPARERIARAIHEKYLTEQAGVKTSEHPSMQTWETLREDLRASNFAQADSIPDKLKVLELAYEAVDTPAYKLASDNRQVFGQALKEDTTAADRVAEMEHERWVAERLRSGWRFAPQRDDSKKLHPDLVPWDKLPDDKKKYDRDAIQAIPEVLAVAGYGLFRPRQGTGTN